jgi:hypothetical protein
MKYFIAELVQEGELTIPSEKRFGTARVINEPFFEPHSVLPQCSCSSRLIPPNSSQQLPDKPAKRTNRSCAIFLPGGVVSTITRSRCGIFP